MITLHLIGIGTGNPDHLTRAAVRALNAADLILLPCKGPDKADLADLRRAILAEVITAPVPVAEFDMPRRAAGAEYRLAVDDWHEAIAKVWTDTIARHLPQGGDVALMVWGDPSLYDSSLRIAGRLGAGGGALSVKVLPGITSLQALTAAHAIPLNTLASPVTITTGRLLRAGGWPEGAVSVAVMLDAGMAYEVLDPCGLHIWWGAYLGLAQESLFQGPLAATAPHITAERARLRALHGWIMDIYLLRREMPDD
ncbi:MAG: precorrin-6A synthase (deacetylating) [Pseudotabrizicola sp.]|uniref:precorrin-6A synthase (deacetylating) n=1 Tax=Pseudotabrizicola sp. TaxID=2939647 RepID=UPI002726DC6D|nr:precorrin-6A synthase (deacetylating) [Pseudotabrizicola sp.]MDO9638427.1 precorrin-6A synthase (deacetylating) [Pseudotabrizicola sp.]